MLPLELGVLLKMQFGIWDVFKCDYSINQVNGLASQHACTTLLSFTAASDSEVGNGMEW